MGLGKVRGRESLIRFLPQVLEEEGDSKLESLGQGTDVRKLGDLRGERDQSERRMGMI